MPDGKLESLEEVERTCLDALTRAALDKKSPMRWPTLVTAGLDRGAEAGIVVLRAFDREGRRASIWTDGRSAKVSELQADPSVTLLFFDKSKMMQMRARGTAEILTDGESWETAFAAAKSASLDDYTTKRPPGAPLSEEGITRELDLASDTFTLIRVALHQIDWLSLSRSGHQRALLDWQESASHSWRVP